MLMTTKTVEVLRKATDGLKSVRGYHAWIICQNETQASHTQTQLALHHVFNSCPIGGEIRVGVIGVSDAGLLNALHDCGRRVVVVNRVHPQMKLDLVLCGTVSINGESRIPTNGVLLDEEVAGAEQDIQDRIEMEGDFLTLLNVDLATKQTVEEETADDYVNHIIMRFPNTPVLGAVVTENAAELEVFTF